MRLPGRYRLGTAVMRLAFGVTPRQRIQPVVEEVERLIERSSPPSPARAAAMAGVLTALAAVLFGIWRRQK
jgi:hypothetical protein